MPRGYVPRRGDIIWLRFHPQAGHEQAGERPALTLSPAAYNRKVGLGIFCPITSQTKGYPFEVGLPSDCEAQGVVLSDQIKNLDWRARKARRWCVAPDEVIEEVTAKLLALIDPLVEGAKR